MSAKFLMSVLAGAILSTSVAFAAQQEVGVTCRQSSDQPKVVEMERQNSGDLVVRISGYNLFGNRMPQARSIEVILHLTNCQPLESNHWMSENLYTCVGPDQPTVRDANGEQLPLPAGFQRLYFKSWMETYSFPLVWKNTFHYYLQLTLNGDKLVEGDGFQTDPATHGSSCRLRYSGN